MENQKRSLGKLGLGVLCSLSESYMMLPFLIFSGLLTGKSTAVNFFLPVIVVYSVQRGCLIALRGFGEITNPYRILKGGLLLSLAGAALMVLSMLYQPLLMASAVLIGVGLSSYRAMFLPIYACVTEGDPALKKGKSVGTLLYLLVMLLALGLGKRRLPVVPVLFLCYIAGALWLLSRLDGNGLFAGRKAFDTAKRKPVYFVFGGLALLCLLILRQYKQSGASALIWLAPAVAAVFIVLEMCRSWNYRDFTYQTYWIGALKCHLLVFSLVYHSSVGNTAMAHESTWHRPGSVLFGAAPKAPGETSAEPRSAVYAWCFQRPAPFCWWLRPRPSISWAFFCPGYSATWWRRRSAGNTWRIGDMCPWSAPWSGSGFRQRAASCSSW